MEMSVKERVSAGKRPAQEVAGTASLQGIAQLLSSASRLEPRELSAILILVERLRSRSDEDVVIMAALPRVVASSEPDEGRAGGRRRGTTRVPLPDLILKKGDDAVLMLIEAKNYHPNGSSWQRLSYAPDLSTSEDFETLHGRNEARKFEVRKRLLSQTYSADEVAKLLGRSKQAVLNRVEARDLLGLIDGKRVRLPIWQFDATTSSGIVEGVAAILKAVDAGPFALASWLSVPNRIFEGQLPIDVLKAGRVDEVVSEARAIGPS